MKYDEFHQEISRFIVLYINGMETEAEGFKTVMIITNAKSSVPADAFDLPEGYMEMSM